MIIIITTIYMAQRSHTEVEGRIQILQRLSSPVSRWILRLRVAHHRTRDTTADRMEMTQSKRIV